MSTSSSVIAAKHDIYVQRGGSFSFYFQFSDADGVTVDLTTIIEVKADVKNIAGKVVCSFSIGNGLEIDLLDNTKLIMSKVSGEKELGPEIYQWDFKMTLQDGLTQYPLRGIYSVTDYITA